MEPFRTVDGRGEAAFEIRGSEFLGYVAPAADIDAVEAFVAEVREAHPDATHVVPAYRVPATAGDDGVGAVGDGGRGADDGGRLLREYADDDGEPSGSAGDPALNVLQGRSLRAVVAAVVRYYGGTNLGVGGLARAYARGVNDAVDDAGVVDSVPHETVVAVVDYDDSGRARSVLESEGVEFEADYAATVTFEARVPVDEAGALRERLRDATSGRVDLDGG